MRRVKLHNWKEIFFLKDSFAEIVNEKRIQVFMKANLKKRFFKGS